jgi:hypothetical protein
MRAATGIAVATALVIALTSCQPVGGGEPTASPADAGVATPGQHLAGGCPAATVDVTDADELTEALEVARPGDVIVVADGFYEGGFVARASGTADDPIVLCGSRDAVLDGDGIRGDYVLHLDGARYWQVSGLTLQNGQKGLVADGTTGSVISGLHVTEIGDEAIHLRDFSTDNLVSGNVIDTTGLRRAKYGEGIYIGTAESNWCDISGCEPDRSDRNQLIGNWITGTTAEAIDIKEGTSDGVVRGNTFDGSEMTDDGADSWVDIKGNDWLIEGNVGTNSLLDGFQTHEILDGWGTRNVFRGNAANVNGPGFGFSLTPVRDNVVTCDNTASAAGEGLSNVTCSG